MPPHDSVPRPPNGGPVVYADLMGWACSICAPIAMTKDEVEAFAAHELEPIGEWEAVDKALMGLGDPTPNPCNQSPDRRHWFLIGGRQAARLESKTFVASVLAGAFFHVAGLDETKAKKGTAGAAPGGNSDGED
jgi:hypothetical protein